MRTFLSASPLSENVSWVIPGDRRETRDPFRTLAGTHSGMDPGSALRSARDDRAFAIGLPARLMANAVLEAGGRL